MLFHIYLHFGVRPFLGISEKKQHQNAHGLCGNFFSPVSATDLVELSKTWQVF